MKRVYLAVPPFAEEYRRRATRLVEALGWEAVDPMRRDFRGRTEGNEAEIVEGDLADIDACEASSPTSRIPMSARRWRRGMRIALAVVAYTGGSPAHPWTVFVARWLHADLEEAVGAL